jgi:hypothetical protein
MLYATASKKVCSCTPTKIAIIAHPFNMMRQFRQELQVLRQELYDVKTFMFAVFGSIMDRTGGSSTPTTTTATDDDEEEDWI